jgi:hypothetical protein
MECITGKRFLVFLFSIFLFAGMTVAEISLVNSPVCKDLLAGKTRDAGNVCFEVSDDNMFVSITTTGGWELMEAHLWLGPDLEAMPRGKKGNPKIGRFPYHSGDITGQTVYIYSIPLAEIAGPDYHDVLCDSDYMVALHSVVRIWNEEEGRYIRKSAWAQGTRIVQRGNWGMVVDVQFECEELPPALQCDDAFGYGDTALWDILDGNGNPITTDWGWQITVNAGERKFIPIYMNAIGNDPSNGTYVGIIYIGYSGSYLFVDYYVFPGYSMKKTHLYAGASQTPTADPDQFGHSHTLPTGDRTDVYHLPITGSTLYVVAHAEVCYMTGGN